MERDVRYNNIHDLILKGSIKSLREVFTRELIKRSKVAKDLGLNPVRFTRNLEKPEKFILKDLYTLAALIGVENMVLLEMIDNDYKETLKAKTKPKKAK
jgi:hypothetical protein